MWLFPGAAIALAKYFLQDAGIDTLRLLLFIVQIICVAYFGIRKLNAFDRRLQSFYADIEGRETTAVHHLLIAIICVSVLSGVANTLGRKFFGESLYLLGLISLAFSVMLFALNYICFIRKFTIEEFEDESVESDAGSDTDTAEDSEVIGKKLEALMRNKQVYLIKNLKINDVVKEIGSNRTYVSNYINSVYHCSFSDYINQLRIEHAKELLLSMDTDTKLSTIANASGYSSESSFYRNFQKIASMTPNEFRNKKGEK